MYFIDNEQVDLSVLNPMNHTGGAKYTGNDEIRAMIAAKWQELYDRYGNEQPITFIRPHMKSGIGKGSMGGSYQRTVMINTRNGTKRVTWCDMAIEKSKGVFDFVPRTFKHTPDQGLTLFLGKDVEQVLWHCLFDQLRDRPYTYPPTDVSGKPHPKAGRRVGGIYILDPNDDAADFLRTGMRSADMWYYLMSDTSPIFGKRNIIDTLASAWGISRPEEKGELIVKQLLIQAIEQAEKTNETAYGYAAFSMAVKNILSGDDTINTEILSLINRALDRNIIKYLSSKLAWFLLSENGVELKKICQVSASNINKSKEVLLQHLLSNDDDLQLIQGSVDAKPFKEKESRRVYIPENPTAEFFLKEMKFPKMKRVAILLGWDHYGKKKDDLAPLLVDYFVTQGKTLPKENLLDAPEQE